MELKAKNAGFRTVGDARRTGAEAIFSSKGDGAMHIRHGGATTMNKTERDRYRTLIGKVLSGDHKDVVFNGTIDHASVVTESAFLAASQKIRLLTNRLDADCYGRDVIVEAMAQFLRRDGARLEILIERDADRATNERFLEVARSVGGNRVDVRAVPTAISEQYNYNFLLMDDSAYRFEDDRRFPVAVVAGGSAAKDQLPRLEQAFAEIQRASRPVDRKTPRVVGTK